VDVAYALVAETSSQRKACLRQLTRSLAELDHAAHSGTPRHRWEAERVKTVAALVSDSEGLRRQVPMIIEDGGDDGVGDYVLPMLRWAERHGVPEEEPKDVAEARCRLEGLSGKSPRLPDLRALQSNARP
jgi:hypothetical protein